MSGWVSRHSTLLLALVLLVVLVAAYLLLTGFGGHAKYWDTL